MCDELTESDNEHYLAKEMQLDRRGFATAVGVIGSIALAPMSAKAAKARKVLERDVAVDTPDGKADCYFVAPASGKSPAILIWPDIFGLRPAFRAMGKRLAEAGYAVLVVNPYYRSIKSPVLPEGVNPRSPENFAKVRGEAAKLSPSTNVIDANAFVAFLDAQAEVDRKRKIGTMGYCMGGPMVMRTAAAIPSRIGAAATFHGGGLATDKPDSPHLLIPKMKASFLIAIAENDDQREPLVKDTLRASFAAAKLSAEIEVYAGSQHGWCPPDSQVYNQAQAEKAWARLLALLGTALKRG